MNKLCKQTIPAICLLLSALLACTFLLCGCGEEKSSAVCPFSTLTWDASEDDVIAAEGDDYETYDSVYDGTTYTYAKRYCEQDGTVKYMFNEDGALMCFAWAMQADDESVLEDVYETLHAELVEKYGESGYNTDKSTNYGDVWHLESGDIVLSIMKTDSQKALQYSYIHPDESYKED